MFLHRLKTVHCNLLVLAAVLFFAEPAARGFSDTDANSAFDAFNKAFYVVSNGRGYYKADTGGGRADFWKQAEQIEIIIDAYERSGSAAYKTMISQSIDGFLNQYGTDWTWNIYNDDIMWMVIACCRGYTATGNATYKDRAKYNFDAAYARGWDTSLGGGLYWTTDRHEKNACVNGPASIAASLLYELSGDAAYLSKAKSLYAWERSTLFESSTGKVFDNISTNGTITRWLFTYNQGTFIGAANYLLKHTGTSSYGSDALRAANYVKNGMCTADILPEYTPGDDSGGFTSVFVRWMARFAEDNKLWSSYYVWMAENANAAWALRRPDNLSWCKWHTPTPGGILPSWGCSSSVAIMQVVPTDYGMPSLIYMPVALTAASYNADIIVEANAPKTGPINATTATMDAGAGNTGFTWFERGYATNAPFVGLPPAGSGLTNILFPNHTFKLASSYAADNAVLLTSSKPAATINPAAPSAFSALSFLTASAHGPVGVNCTVRHADGSVQLVSFPSPDWVGQSPMAFVVNGRVSVSTAGLDAIAANTLRLYTADILIANTLSPVTNISFAIGSGANNACAAVLAVSGIPGTVPPQIPVSPKESRGMESSNVMLSASVLGVPAPILQWQKKISGVFVDLFDSTNISGAKTTNLLISGLRMSDAGDYRLCATNSSGGATSQVAILTVLSGLPNVFQPGDSIGSIGGNSPAAENVAKVIDRLTSKYLNFGLNDGSGSFRGPVGFSVRPALGLSIVNCLRFYTANDEPGRDPSSYELHGSTDDGLSYSLISSGPLTLPDTRNLAGLPLNPLGQSLQQISFVNSRAYTTYKVVFNTIKTNSAAMTQVGEVELLGRGVPILSFASGASPGWGILRATQPGRLWSTTVLAGTNTIWLDAGAIAGQVSIPISNSVSAVFYQVTLP